MNISREHIAFTLGIPVPLNESINVSESLKLHIINEQLIYESFLDSIKTFAKEKFDQVITTIKDWKDAAVVMGKVLSNGDLLNDFLKPLERRVEKLIQPLTDLLKKMKLDSFIEKIKQFIDKIKSLQGWKKFMALVTTGSIITYIVEKLKSLAPDAVKDFLTKYFSPTFVEDVLGKLTDFQSYLGFLQPIVKGVEIIFNFLKPLIEAFAVALKSGGKFATKLVKENQNLEFNMKDRFQKLAGIKEVAPTSPTTPNPNKPDSSVATISKDLEDQSSNFRNISTKEKMEQLLDALVNKIDPKFKESAAFKQSVLAFYNKYK